MRDARHVFTLLRRWRDECADRGFALARGARDDRMYQTVRHPTGVRVTACPYRSGYRFRVNARGVDLDTPLADVEAIGAAMIDAARLAQYGEDLLRNA